MADICPICGGPHGKGLPIIDERTGSTPAAPRPAPVWTHVPSEPVGETLLAEDVVEEVVIVEEGAVLELDDGPWEPAPEPEPEPEPEPVQKPPFDPLRSPLMRKSISELRAMVRAKGERLPQKASKAKLISILEDE